MISTKSRAAPIEIELKYSLTKAEYSLLKDHLTSRPHTTKTQTNYYFDSLQLSLRNKKTSLRIRTSGSKTAIVCLKFPTSQKKHSLTSLKINYEYEENISLPIAKQIIKGHSSISLLDVIPLSILNKKFSPNTTKRLLCLGSLKTKRTTYRRQHGHLFELDESQYLGKVFYELEVETHNPEKADLLIKNLFKEKGISYRPDKISKNGKFFIDWKKLFTKKKA